MNFNNSATSGPQNASVYQISPQEGKACLSKVIDDLANFGPRFQREENFENLLLGQK